MPIAPGARFHGRGVIGSELMKHLYDAASECTTVVAWVDDPSVEGSHRKVPVTAGDVVAALLQRLDADKPWGVKRKVASDSEEFTVAGKLDIDPDVLNERAQEIYERDFWTPGMASWVNAGWSDRRACRTAAQAEFAALAQRSATTVAGTIAVEGMTAGEQVTFDVLATEGDDGYVELAARVQESIIETADQVLAVYAPASEEAVAEFNETLHQVEKDSFK
jgi:hypothetical protein